MHTSGAIRPQFHHKDIMYWDVKIVYYTS